MVSDLGGTAIVRRDYREDIDWLRAIAVLAVVAFHFEAPAVFGGFVGVDIFFVISGFLITGIIQSEVKADNFSFARFYERRVRRLLPALYAMVVLTAIPAFHYLLTSERAEFFRSVAAVVTFTSNFFFWFQTGYFDHAAVEKPLLHTWSLAVEEQFYLALPLLLFVLLRVARAHVETVMPGYTHLQRAQPVSLAHHLMAYGEMLERDRERLAQVFERAAADQQPADGKESQREAAREIVNRADGSPSGRRC